MLCVDSGSTLALVRRTQMATELEDKTPKQVIVEGINLLAQGKRNLLCGEVHQAVNQLEEAAKIL